jgi:hypothetical protein
MDNNNVWKNMCKALYPDGHLGKMNRYSWRYACRQYGITIRQFDKEVKPIVKSGFVKREENYPHTLYSLTPEGVNYIKM